MNRSMLTEKDKINLADLLKITQSIRVLYDRLYKLELSGKLQGKQVQTIIYYLKIALEVEDRVYKKLNLTYDKCIEIMKLLTAQKYVDDDIFYTENALFKETNSASDNDAFYTEKALFKDTYSMNDDDVFYTENTFHRGIYSIIDDRILSRLKNFIIDSKHDFHPEFFPSLKSEMEEELENDNEDYMLQGVLVDETAVYEFLDSITDDNKKDAIRLDELLHFYIEQNFLFFAQRMIDRRKNKKVTAHLLKSKYKLSFTNQKLEQNLLQKNFEISKRDIFGRQFSDCVSTLRSDPMDDSYKKNLNSLVYICVEDLLKITNDQYYKYEDVKMNALVNMLYLKSVLYLCDKKSVFDLDKVCMELINMEPTKTFVTRQSYELVKKAFETAKRYKETSQL